MRDQVSWGFYIGNFTFLVGVAAAAVMLVIPAYIYNWKPIREIVIYGELLAISAITDVPAVRDGGYRAARPFLAPDSALRVSELPAIHPGVGCARAQHLLPRELRRWPPTFCTAPSTASHYIKNLVVPLVLLSIPMAVGIHTVTAFLYNGLAARPYWNRSILAPQFLASAFCSGPAILLVVLQLLRRFTRFEIQDAAIWKIAELMAYAMFLNLFLHGAEAFKEFYSNTQHLLFTRYWYLGPGRTSHAGSLRVERGGAERAGVRAVHRAGGAPQLVTLNIGCLATYAGVYIEKGMGLIIPGLTPDTLGEIYEYYPTVTELRVAAGIFAVGFLMFTLMLKVAVPISLGEFMGEHGEYDEAGRGRDESTRSAGETSGGDRSGEAVLPA